MILGNYCQVEDHDSIRQRHAHFSLDTAKSVALLTRACPLRGEKSASVEYKARRASTEERHSDAWTVNQRDPFSVHRAKLLPVPHKSQTKFYPPYNLVTFLLFFCTHCV